MQVLVLKSFTSNVSDNNDAKDC